jgi:citrate synthase
MSRKTKPIRSELAWSSPTQVVVRGRDLPSEILGHLNLGDMAFLELMGRMPDSRESTVFNAMVVALVEHGMTPSALAARLTYAGAPESLQAAVGAGLCGLGSVFVGSMENAARMLYEARPEGRPRAELEAIAARIVAEHREAGRIIPGVGHPLHKPVDPRTPRLFEIAETNGFAGPYIALMQLIGQEAEKASGKQLPINVTGAIGAMCCELGFPWHIVRGIGVMARAVGLVGHLLEESRNPIAVEIWQRAEHEASTDMREAAQTR